MDNADWFECPSCHARYNWLVPQAGRRVRCRCSSVLRIPHEPNQIAQGIELVPQTPSPDQTQPTEEAAHGAFVFSLESENPQMGSTSNSSANPTQQHNPQNSQPSLRCMNCGQNLAANAALCVQCGTPVKSHAFNRPRADPSVGQAVSDLMDEPVAAAIEKHAASQNNAEVAMENIRKKYEYSQRVEEGAVARARFIDIILPFVLNGLGFAMIVFYVLNYESPIAMLKTSTWFLTLTTSMQLVVNFTFLFLGLFFVARLFGDAIGTLGLTVWKLSGLVVFCVAADAMFYWGLDIITEGHAFIAGYVRLIFHVLVFFPLAGLLLELDFLELVVLFLFGRLMPAVLAIFAVPIIISLFQ